MLTVLFLFISGYGCAGAAGAMSGGGENAQFGATAAMVAAATSAAMQDSQPFSQVKKKAISRPSYPLLCQNTNKQHVSKVFGFFKDVILISDAKHGDGKPSI